MTKKKMVEKKKDSHGLTPEQFKEWELSEVNLEIYKKERGIK